MARCIFENLTKEQAKMLSTWYCEQGEQDLGIWAEIHDIPVPYWDSEKKVDDDIIVKCKS